MGTFVATSHKVHVGALDLTSLTETVDIGNLSIVAVPFTNFGSGGFVENKPGLANMDVTVSFFNDFAAANIDATFGPAAIAGTLLYFDFKPTSASRAATNPSYVCALYIASYPPLGAQVGGAAETQIGFMLAGKYARLTS